MELNEKKDEGVVQNMNRGGSINELGVVQNMNPNYKKVNNKNITIQDEQLEPSDKKPEVDELSFLDQEDDSAPSDELSFLDQEQDSAPEDELAFLDEEEDELSFLDEEEEVDIQAELMSGIDTDSDQPNYDTFPQMKETFNPEVAKKFAMANGLNEEQAAHASSLAQTTIFGNAAWGETFEQQMSDNTALSLGMGVSKAIISGIGGIIDIWDKDKNAFEKKYEELDSIQTKGLMEALQEGDKSKFYLRSVNKGVGDIGGNLLLMGKMMAAVNGLAKGKNLSLVAKGKTYKELFKITSLRSTFMGAYTMAFSSGSLEERTKSAAIMAGMSMTPCVLIFV
jgi:hypothetical protein